MSSWWPTTLMPIPASYAARKARSAARRSFAKPLLRIDPKSQVQIAAFVPELYAPTAELPEPRNFLPERLGDRTDHGHALHLGKRRPCLGHHVRRHAELALAFQHEAVLLLDRGAA